MTRDDPTIQWLLAGDPVIRWQVMRDLLAEPKPVWQRERNRVATEGWGAGFLSRQSSDDTWPQGRWTETTWTLLLLIDCGMPAQLPGLARAVDAKFSSLLPPGKPADLGKLKNHLDLCHVGFWLRFGSAFLPGDVRLEAMVNTILELQLDDGGWNCRVRNYPGTKHSSFHTTFNILEGLREARACGLLKQSQFEKIESRALNFMLAHRLYKSDKTGEVVHESMTLLTFPSYWHYTVLRGLDYIRTTNFIGDPRLSDAFDLLQTRQKPNGRWPLEKRVAGITFFDMEKPGGDSRWNTLRALRVLKARTKANRTARLE